jgi:hypothetical protein
MRRSRIQTGFRGGLVIAGVALLITGGFLLSGEQQPAFATDVENPKVRPGDVKWHPDFDAACAAATKSGRPVLLFQMMGNLDEAFT